MMTIFAAIGYVILAMKELGYSRKEIERVESTMKELMDFIDEEKAEDVYMKF